MMPPPTSADTPPDSRIAPDSGAVRSHLDQILSSQTFHNSAHARRFLRFVVEHVIDGQLGRLKEYTIALEVFGRDVSFDPRTDTVVRTEARRLRQRLQHFYASEGAQLPLRIVLRKGGYVPEFETVEPSVIAPVLPVGAAAVVPAPRPRRWFVWIAAAASAALVLTVLTVEHLLSKEVAVSPPNSIVVLPFANGGSPEHEFLSDGITEAIIESLGRTGDLRVVGRASAFQFKGEKIDIREVGRNLGVRYVLEGTVQRSGDRLRISTWLADASNGYRVWSQAYDRQAQDALIIEQDIATSITAALGATLGDAAPGARPTIRPVRRVSPKAYELYLKGRYFWHRSNLADFETAMKFLREAIAEDPNYAEAHASLASCYFALWTRSSSTLADVLPLARAAAQRAVALDNSLGEAHTAVAQVYRAEGDWDAAEAEFKKGVALSPQSPVVYRGYSTYLAHRGQIDQAIEQQKIARDLDPISPYEVQRLAQLLYLSGRYADSVIGYQKALELEPNFGLAHLGLGMTYVAQKRYPEGIASLRRGYELLPDVRASAQLAYGYAVSGDRHAAEQILARLLEQSKREGVPAVTLAQVYVGLGQTDTAFQWLSRAIEEREAPTLPNPVFAALTADRRFEQMLPGVTAAAAAGH